MHVCVYISGCYIYTYTAKIWPVMKIAPNLNTSQRNYYVFVFCFMISQKPVLFCWWWCCLFFGFFFFWKNKNVITSRRCFHNCCSWLGAVDLCAHGVSGACLSHTPWSRPAASRFLTGNSPVAFLRTEKRWQTHICMAVGMCFVLLALRNVTWCDRL